MLRAKYIRYVLQFKEPAITSRETMTRKETFFVKVWHEDRPESYGIGECAIFRGLSADDTPDYEYKLSCLCDKVNATGEYVAPFESSIRFGFETALADLDSGCVRRPFPSPWSLGIGSIEINGLVWMGAIDEMRRRVEQKLQQGFRCVKFKIGGQDFEQELGLLRQVRSSFNEHELEIRLDANGAFTPDVAMQRLHQLAPIGIHSIEQPIRQHQWQEMARICAESPIPIALDEELIGTTDDEHKKALLDTIRPQYIILKPSLCGGIADARQWISMAQQRGIGWWVTSALESNIGLNALAQWVSILDVKMPQGLGTGNLYTNNIGSPLRQIGSGLVYDPKGHWQTLDML